MLALPFSEINFRLVHFRLHVPNLGVEDFKQLAFVIAHAWLGRSDSRGLMIFRLRHCLGELEEAGFLQTRL